MDIYKSMEIYRKYSKMKYIKAMEICTKILKYVFVSCSQRFS